MGSVDAKGWANHRVPSCPSCGSDLGYRNIDLVNPFECKECKKLLSVERSYLRGIHWTCTVLAFLSCLLLAAEKRNIIYFLMAPVVLFILATVAIIIAKRIIPPRVHLYAHSEELSLFPHR